MPRKTSAHGRNVGTSAGSDDRLASAGHLDSDHTTNAPAAQDVVIDKRAAGWFWIDNEIVDAYGPRVGAYGIAVYAVLAREANNDTQRMFPKQQTIAEALGLSRATVNAAIARLVDAGLVAVRVQYWKLGGRSYNEYTLLTPGTNKPRVPTDKRPRKKRNAVNDVDSVSQPQRQRESTTLTASVNHSDSINKTHENNTHGNKTQQNNGVALAPVGAALAPTAAPGGAGPDLAAVAAALADICQRDMALPSQAREVNKGAAELCAGGYGPERVRDFLTFWKSDSWRAEHTPVPTIKQVLETIKQAKVAEPYYVVAEEDGYRKVTITADSRVYLQTTDADGKPTVTAAKPEQGKRYDDWAIDPQMAYGRQRERLEDWRKALEANGGRDKNGVQWI